MAESRFIVGGKDTYADSADNKKDKNFSGANGIEVRAGNGVNVSTRYGYIRMWSPVPPGAVVTGAVLVLYQGAATGAGKTVRLKALTQDPNWGNLTWQNRPNAPGGDVAVTTEAGGTPAVHPWWFDVTAYYQAVADGQPNLGFRIQSDNEFGLNFYSSENPNAAAHPVLVIVWSTAPDQPTRLKPAGTVVGLTKPVVSCDYTDRSGSTQLQSIQVQIDQDGEFSSDVAWDSGEVPVNQPALNLATTSYPGLPSGQTTWWRVRVKDADNNWSDWSEPTWFTSTAKGVLTIIEPSGTPAVVTEYTPTIEWTFVGAAQTHFQVQVTSPNGQDLYHDSGKIASASTGYALPKRILNNAQEHRVVVYVWDNLQREATQGDPSYVQAEKLFTVEFDPTVPPPDALEATQVGITPFVQLEWERDPAPDSWTITRDDGAGEFALDTDLTPAEAEVPGSPGVYRFPDWTVRPFVPHTYRVRAEVGGKLSSTVLTDTITTAPQGVWLVDPATNEYVVLGNRDGMEFSSEDNAQSYAVLGSLDVVRSVMGLSGLSGTCQNMLLRTREGIDWREYEERMYRFKQKPAHVFRLVIGDLNIPVILGDIVVAPHPQTRGDQPLKSVSFSWWQTSEHPFSGQF